MIDDEVFMEKASQIWMNIGRGLANRPAQVCGLLAGCLVVLTLLIYSGITSAVNHNDIEQIQHSFCNGSTSYSTVQRQNCQQLLDKLLKDPTPEQAIRLREIIRRQP